MPTQTRQLAAIMFTDIVGYTALMGEDEERAFQLLKENRHVQRPIIEKHGGKWLKEMGDGILASFTTVSDAVYCAKEIQEACLNKEDLKLRIGIHLGEVVFEDEDVFGDGVNIASRLESIAPIGGIYISESVHKNVLNKRGVETKFVKEQHLKNVKEPVRIYKVEVSSEISGKKGTSKKATRIPNKVIMLTLAIALVLLLVYSLIEYLPFGKRELKTDVDRSIAVIPFRDDSKDEDTKAFTNGVMEGIINNLAKISELRIPGRTSVEQFRETTETIPQIGEKLNVSYILGGSVQKFGNRIKVNIQLLLTETDEHLWSDSYEYTYESQFKIIAEIAENVAREIEVNISPQEKQRIEKIPTDNLTAYDFYQRAREKHVEYWLDNYNREALERAEDLYLEALENDSTFALAYTGLAQVYRDKHYWETFLTENFLDSMLILADIALSFDNQLAEAYIIRGDYFRSNNKVDQAINEYDKAIRFNPNSGQAYWHKGEIYYHDDLVKTIDNLQKAASLERGHTLPGKYRRIGRAYAMAGFKEKGHYYVKEALKLDDDSAAYYSDLVNFEDLIGNYDKAIEFGKRSYTIDSTDYLIIYLLGVHHMFLGQFEESLEYFRKYEKRLKTLDKLHPWGTFRIGHAYWVNGYKEEAEYYFNKALEFHNEMIELGRHYYQDFHTFYNLAAIYAFKEDKDKAYENLRLVNQRQRMPLWMLENIKNDPLFNSLRDDSEFQQIVKDVEVKYQAEHERVRQWLEENDML